MHNATSTVARLRARLAAGETCWVVNADFADASLVEFVCTLGVDAIVIDCEQGTPHIESVAAMHRAARVTDTAALVRLQNPAPWEIERTLLRGVHGLIVPRLDTPRQASDVVDTIRYVLPHDHENRLLVIQIESKAAIAALDDFIAIPGIDCLFVGPVDLAKSMGFAGNHGEPEVTRLITDTIGRIRAGGRAAGMLVTADDHALWQDRGANFLYHHVWDYLRIGHRQFIGHRHAE